jgi:hypothetical protein
MLDIKYNSILLTGQLNRSELQMHKSKILIAGCASLLVSSVRFWPPGRQGSVPLGVAAPGV